MRFLAKRDFQHHEPLLPSTNKLALVVQKTVRQTHISSYEICTDVLKNIIMGVEITEGGQHPFHCARFVVLRVGIKSILNENVGVEK